MFQILEDDSFPSAKIYLNIICQSFLENVPYGLQTGWLKCDKWQLAKNLGSLEWFLSGSQFDPISLGSSIEGKSKWLLKALSTHLLAVLSQKFSLHLGAFARQVSSP